MFRHSRNKLVLWACATMVTAGMSGMQGFFEDVLVPYAKESAAPAGLVFALNWFSGKLNAAVHAFPHWTILVFFLHYSGFANGYLHALLTFPPAIIVWNSATEAVDFCTVFGVGAVYAAAAWALFAVTVARERERTKMLHHAVVASVFLIPQVLLLIYQGDGYVFTTPVDTLVILAVILAICSVLVVMLYAKNAFLGLRREETSRRLEIGTAML